MEVFEEGELNKTLTVPKEFRQKTPRKTIYDIIKDEPIKDQRLII